MSSSTLNGGEREGKEDGRGVRVKNEDTDTDHIRVLIINKRYSDNNNNPFVSFDDESRRKG